MIDPVYLFLLIAIVFWLVVFYYFMLRPILKYIKLQDTGKVTDNFYTIKAGLTQMYIYKKGEIALAFDAGNYKPKKLQEEFKKLEIDPKEITHVFFTHTDVDQIQGLPLMKNSTIYVSREEVHRKKQQMRLFRRNRKLPKDVNKEWIESGDKIQVGDITVEATSLPGHTKGSLGFIIEDSKKILIVGDAVQVENGKLMPSANFINDNTRAARRSVNKVKKMSNIDLICTGHSGILKNEDRKSTS